MPQFNGKQEATRHGADAHLRCPRNGQRSDFSFCEKSRFVNASHWVLPETARLGRRRSAPASPDTGQQGGGASVRAPP
jgi:hypothetical protein